MKLVSLTPSFSSAQDAPSFVLTLQNDSPRPLDILELLQGSSLVLDGKPFRRQIIKFAGNTQLAPGETHLFRIALDEYLPAIQKQGYSPVLKRWRWNLRLDSGKHVLVVRMGNDRIGPVEFLWEGDTPLLYR